MLISSVLIIPNSNVLLIIEEKIMLFDFIESNLVGAKTNCSKYLIFRAFFSTFGSLLFN